ncbi:unnamed protein product [Arabis nemorensis]|uniref:UDP-glycosyltransferases domain-containing protein n=1 Tax=Arabis nemorensis TaxID=586526 RepID=A0A565BIY3_9BRAS|nr:unnamed protein product [Arabis nemorensis]
MLKFAKQHSPTSLHYTLATTEQARNLLCAATIDEPRSPLDLAFFSDGLPKDDPRADESVLESLRNVGHKNLSKIIGEKRFSCIISSPFTPWVPAVAAAHNIPCAILWIQACGAYSIYYRYYNKTNSFPDDLEDLNQTVDLPALPLLEVRDLPSFLLPCSGSHFSKLMKEFTDCLRNVKWALVNSFYELESEIIESMCDLKPLIPIGPLWLDKQARSSVVYISFGSILKSSEDQVESIATALKNRGVSFLWVIRPKKRGENVHVLQEMVKEGQGVVIEWGPQEKILSHAAISCFVTHCGVHKRRY